MPPAARLIRIYQPSPVGISAQAMLPSFYKEWTAPADSLPRIYLLAVRERHLPNGEPVQWILVERSETRLDRQDGSTITASIRLSFKPLRLSEESGFGDHESFNGNYSSGPGGHDAKISITGGSLMIRDRRLRSKRIGTHLMNEVVRWAQQWPTAVVRAVSVSSVDDYLDKGDGRDGEGIENKLRRNLLYENFGLEMIYADDLKAEGHSLPMLARELIPRDTWKRNIEVRGVPGYIRDLRNDIAALKRQDSERSRHIEDLENQIKSAERSPVIWACRQVRLGLCGKAPWMAFLGFISLLLWMVFSWLSPA